MRDAYHKELEVLRERVVAMADLARGMLNDGVRSLVDLDAVRAQSVLEKKDVLADLDDEIESMALHVVARQQPMASDLRQLAAALKLITYINRVGRYGKDIAQVANEWPGGPHVARLVQIPLMAEILVKMLDAVMQAYRAGTRMDLERLKGWEDQLDTMRWTVFRECLVYMNEDPKNIEPCSHYVMIARYLERAGDNTCKMAEKTHYMVTGERLTIK